MRAQGFLPVFDGNSTILILGSFPSVISRKVEFYYGNKQNRFWKMLASAFEVPLPETVDAKRELVLSRGIALWDIVTSCEIEGSMDADIKDYTVADLGIVLGAAPIKKILLNGAKAYGIFADNYPELVGLAKRMPSTSSANVGFSYDVWLEELK